MRRGARRWGPFAAAVLCGVFGVGAVPAGGAEAPSYRLRVEVVAYHATGLTSSGAPTGRGIVAVDPKVFPLGTRMFVPRYGLGVAADTGTAIKGRLIDVWMPSKAQARRWGRKTLIVTVFR